ncbi:MAG TPA: EamA family transporter [Candidatus Dormibacteraeota bacterium]|nr:EamA family transporter [Candidatus Dormibacteraeota bacterium]
MRPYDDPGGAGLTRLLARRPGINVTTLVALGTLYILWGSTYLAIRFGIATIPPLLMASVRFLLAGALMYLWALQRGDLRDGAPTARHWLATLVIGGLLLGVGNGGVTWGEQFIASGVAALLVATVPVWMAILAHLTGQERLSRLVGAGLVLGIAGVVLVAHPWSGTFGQVKGVVVVLLAAFGWACGSLYARRAGLPTSAILVTGMEMICGGLVLLVAASLDGELGRVHPEHFSPASVLAVLYLVVFGSIIAFSAYVWLLNHVSAALAGTYAFVNPAVAVFLGALFAHEALSAAVLVGGAVIIGGVALVVAGRSVTSRNERRAALVAGRARAA